MYNDLENHMVLGDYPIVPRFPGIPTLEQIEAARERAARLTIWQLCDWVDDMDLILSKMDPEARDNYLSTHRELVARAIARTECA